jgi:ATP-dependent Clp protease ATP-binding subunit ClpA
VVSHVVNKFIFQLESQLAERHVTIELADAARAWLAEKGYDKSNGARPLARLIAEKIKKQLADEVLFGKLAKGGTVRIDVKDGELAFTFEKPASPRKTQDEESDELV